MLINYNLLPFENANFPAVLLHREMDKHENIFSAIEVRRLVNVFKETLANNGVFDGQMSRKIFRQFLHERLGVRCKNCNQERLNKNSCSLFSEIFMADRMFDFFNHDGKDDITKTEWVSGLQVIMKGTEEQQAEFCFQVKKLQNGIIFIRLYNLWICYINKRTSTVRLS